MSKYLSSRLAGTTLDELVQDLEKELKQIELVLMDPTLSHIRLTELHAEPEKLFDGMVVLADGTDWNPDATNGKGVYRYNGSTWDYLG